MIWAAWLAVLALMAYNFSLGAAAVAVFRLYRTPIRYVPGIATLAYYALSYYHPNPAWVAALNGAPYAVPDAFRMLASAVAIGLALRLLGKRVMEQHDRF